MWGTFNFEKLLKLSSLQNPDYEGNKVQDEYLQNMHTSEMAQLEEIMAAEAEKEDIKLKQKELIQRTIMNINKWSISGDTIVKTPKKKRLRSRKRGKSSH